MVASLDNLKKDIARRKLLNSKSQIEWFHECESLQQQLKKLKTKTTKIENSPYPYYKGNSIGWWSMKAQFYGDVIVKCWNLVGGEDGETSITDRIKLIMQQLKDSQERVKELEGGVKKLRNQNYCSMCGTDNDFHKVKHIGNPATTNKGDYEPI